MPSGFCTRSRQPRICTVWGSNGRELFYRSATDSIVSVEVAPGPAFHAGAQHALFSTANYYPDSRHAAFAVMPDSRFVFVRNLPSVPARFMLLTNWLEELKRKVPK